MSITPGEENLDLLDDTSRPPDTISSPNACFGPRAGDGTAENCYNSGQTQDVRSTTHIPKLYFCDTLLAQCLWAGSFFRLGPKENKKWSDTGSWRSHLW